MKIIENTSLKIAFVVLLGLLIIPGTSQAQLNKIESRTARTEITSTLQGNENRDQVSTDIQFSDGLGRPAQDVSRYASPDGYDVIQPYQYDNLGRTPKSYLPYVRTEAVSGETGGFAYTSSWESNLDAYTSAASGESPPAWAVDIANYAETLSTSGEHATACDWQTDFREFSNLISEHSEVYPNAWETDLAAFYNADGDNLANSDYYWSESTYDGSPLNRVLASNAPGNAWSKCSGNKPVSSNFRTNALSDNIHEFALDHDAQQTLSRSGYYAAGLLSVNETNNENGDVIMEFTDKDGQVVCKKVQSTATDYLSTYYVYDDFGSLAFVLPPESIPRAAQDWSVNLNDANFRKDWFFRYKYDGRRRMVEKQVPGAEPLYMVYDSRDRLVLTQDGNLRGEGEQIIVDNETLGLTSTAQGVNFKIENNGVVVLSPGFTFKAASGGQVFYAGDKAFVNDNGDNNRWLFTKYDALNRPVITGIVELNETISDIRADVMNQSIDSLYESVTAAGYGYTNKSYPAEVLESDLLTVTYYDTYAFTGLLAYNWGTVFDNATTPSDPYMDRATGYATGLMTRTLTADGSGQWLKSATYYDDRYRVTKSIAENLLGGHDITVGTYANQVNNNILTSTRTHTASGEPDVEIRETFAYDHRDRLLTVDHRIRENGSVKSNVTLVENDYNEIGELIKKDIGDDRQEVDYAYNIRGWMTDINDVNDLSGDAFAMNMRYINPSADADYNGNIGRIQWKTLTNASSGASTGLQSYYYGYDKLNRLTSADYSVVGNISLKDHFDVHISSYDDNGNINGLTRKMNGVLEDDLVYSYTGNQLSQVEDSGDDGKLFKDEDHAPGTQEYWYDANGNMIVDDNKGITGIIYNHLNLPMEVTLTSGSVIEYTYNAAGTKLRKKVTNGSSIPITNYIAGIHYENNGAGDALKFIQHGEGRVLRDDGGSYQHNYNLTDHLGNVRATIDESGEVVQRDDYYPFGLRFNSSSTSPENLYKYNGKEEQKEWGVHDFDTRMHDPALGRFMGQDLLSDRYAFQSPYAYAANNPIRFIDFLGMGPLEGGGNTENGGIGDIEGKKPRTKTYSIYGSHTKYYDDDDDDDDDPALRSALIYEQTNDRSVFGEASRDGDSQASGGGILDLGSASAQEIINQWQKAILDASKSDGFIEFNDYFSGNARPFVIGKMKNLGSQFDIGLVFIGNTSGATFTIRSMETGEIGHLGHRNAKFGTSNIYHSIVFTSLDGTATIHMVDMFLHESNSLKYHDTSLVSFYKYMRDNPDKF